ncbi:unnamed protein product, partial [Arabidopsis halleri]
MPPKKDEEQAANWAELRSTLLAMQESMQHIIQTSIQTSIQASMRELGETLTQYLQPPQQLGEQRNKIVEVNPFAPGHQDGNRELIMRRPDQRDSRWEAGFTIDILQYGGLRGDALVDWLVTVEESLISSRYHTTVVYLLWPRNFADMQPLGLRTQLQNLLAQFDPKSIAEAHRRAASFEQQQRSGGWSSTSNRGRAQELSSPKSETAPKENADTTTPRPNQTTEDPALRRSSRNAMFCFSCGEPEHRQTTCPHQTRRGLLVDDQFTANEPLYDSNEEEQSNTDYVLHHTHGDHGPLLLVGCTCHIPKAKTDAWLRTNIFRSTFTIKGCHCTAVCSFIIDSGSSRNVIAEEAVRKLCLPVEKHPTPYNLGWLSDVVNMRVTHRSMVPFSIGPYYKDRMYCDIAPIDVCHLLLGRPWEYDRKITHDGVKNTYRFLWETHQILLMPSREPVASEPSPTRSIHSRLSFPPIDPEPTQYPIMRSVHSRITFPQAAPESTLLCSYSVFDQEFRKEGVAYALFPAGTKEQRPTASSSLFKPVLREFADVFPSYLPPGLPLLRDIQHQIDLIPGATLPHYRRIPLEHEELRRQV